MSYIENIEFPTELHNALYNMGWDFDGTFIEVLEMRKRVRNGECAKSILKENDLSESYVEDLLNPIPNKKTVIYLEK